MNTPEPDVRTQNPGAVAHHGGRKQVPKRRTCLYGCLIGALGMAILAGSAVFAGVAAWMYGTRFIQKTVEQYTDDAPMAFPKAELTPEQANDLFDRLDAFKATLDGSGEMRTLVLSAQELNAFVQYQPQLTPLADHVYFEIENDKIGGRVSFPLGNLPLPPFLGTEGRFLNGTATFDVVLTAGQLGVYMESVFVKGNRLPERFLSCLRAQNLAQDMLHSPDVMRIVLKIEEITVENGKLKITLKEGA